MLFPSLAPTAAMAPRAPRKALRPPPPRADHHRAGRGNSVAAPLDAAFGHKSVADALGGGPAPPPTMSAAPPTGPRWAPPRSADPG